MRWGWLSCWLPIAAGARVNCSLHAPKRVRGGDRVAARVDVAVAADQSIFESLVVELRGPVTFRAEAPGLEPSPYEDDVIFAVRRRERAFVVRLGARRRRSIWASFAVPRDGGGALRVAATAALGDEVAACAADVAVVAPRDARPRAGCAALGARAASTALVLGERTTVRAVGEDGPVVVPLPFGVAHVAGGSRVDGRRAVRLDAGEVATVVAVSPGYFAADAPRARGRGTDCARGAAGLAVAVGTARGDDGALKIGDVDHPDHPRPGAINPDDDART